MDLELRRGGFRIQFIAGAVKVKLVDPITGRQREVAAGNISDWTNYYPTPNDQRHFTFKISKSSFKGYVNGIKFIESAPGAFSLSTDKFNVYWALFSYNNVKDMRTVLDFVHWDNFGFTAPANYSLAEVVHSYYEQNNGTTRLRNSNNYIDKADYDINVPDPVADTGGTSANARFYFTMMGFYFPNARQEKINVNGVDIPVASAPYQDTNILANWGGGTYYFSGPRSLYVDIPRGVVKSGHNKVSIKTNAATLMNPRLALIFPSSKEPAYTQPDIAAPGVSYPTDLPEIGPQAYAAAITSANGTLGLDPARDGPSQVSTTVLKGVATFTALADNFASWKGSGTNLGITKVQLLVDNVVVAERTTNIDFPACSANTQLKVDTRTLTNGTHAFLVRAYNSIGTKSYSWFEGNYGNINIEPVLNIAVRN